MPKLAVCVVVVLGAGVLAGCGGGEDSGAASTASSSADSAGEGTSASAGDPGAASGAEKPDLSRSTSKENPDSSQPAIQRGPHEQGKSLPAEEADPPTPGFEDTSDQTDIPAFGVEAGGEERMTAQAVLEAFFRASAREEWSMACAHLHPLARLQLLEAVARSSQAADCGDALSTAIKDFPGAHEPVYGDATSVTALRVENGGGFALFHGTDGNDYWSAMRTEGDEWKVLSLVPQLLR
jgi:hypothetical protein